MASWKESRIALNLRLKGRKKKRHFIRACKLTWFFLRDQIITKYPFWLWIRVSHNLQEAIQFLSIYMQAEVCVCCLLQVQKLNVLPFLGSLKNNLKTVTQKWHKFISLPSQNDSFFFFFFQNKKAWGKISFGLICSLPPTLVLLFCLCFWGWGLSMTHW